MAIQSNFPAIRPSLLLDFANSKRLDPRITFTRASTARFYDGSTVAKAEENLVTYSQVVDDAAWTKTNTTATADQTTAPDGTSTADLLAETTANNVHQLSRSTNISITSGLTYTYSVFLKKGTGATAPDVMQLSFASGQFGATQYANFDINTGTVGTTAGGITASIVSVGSGWYRCVITLAATGSSTTSAMASVSFTNNNDGLGRNPSYAGATTSDVFVWGAQLEQRSAVTAYTATTTAPITNYVPVLQTAAAGVPRFDHNPTTGESLGLLIEEARTNTILQSETFGTTWTATRSSVMSNTRIAPDGTLTSDRLIDTTDNDTHFLTQTFTGTAASWTMSVYAKAAGHNFVALRLYNGTTQVGLAYYNLSTGATGTVTAGTASITSVGNGWYRCVLTATLAASASCTADIQLASADGTNSFAGNGWNSVALWGAQVELGAFATSYIPTVAASATRQADAASMTGTNFSSWYDAAEGTVYAEARDAAIVDASIRLSVIDINNANTTEAIRFGKSTAGGGSNIVYFNVANGGADQAYIGPTGTITANTAYRYAATYKVNDFAATLNAGTVGTDTAGTIPVVSQMNIGARGNGTNRYNGTLAKFAYYPLRLTNAQLQAITG